MRAGPCLCLLALIAGCASSNRGPSLAISPAGSVQITGPTQFSAILANRTADTTVTWSISGGGTLSNTSGYEVTYMPPPGTATAMLTASAVGLTATVQITSGPAVLTGDTIPGLSAPVTVEYDAENIPHIQCAVARDCFAVQGYVQARDRLFQMDFLRHVARSNLAELVGVDGLSSDVQMRTLFITRAGHRIEDDLAAAMDPDMRATLNAYVGGINAYLAQLRATPGARLPAEYEQLPYPLTPADIADWTPQDTWAFARLLQFQLSESLSQELSFAKFAAVYAQGPLADGGKLSAWLRAAAPPTEQAHTLAPGGATAARAAASPGMPTVDLSAWRDVIGPAADRAAVLRDELRRAGVAAGSNNWVVSAAKSATHVAMVANDPHLALQYPPLFHLFTMTSATASDHLDLAGGAFPGIPGALVGRGQHVGWGVTVVGYDVTDLYLEQFLPQASCPSAAPCVLFRGVPTATLPVPETFRVRVGPGGALVDAKTLSLPEAPPPVVLVVPQHGPILQAPDATGKALSVRWTGQEGNTQDLRAFLGVDTATDVDDAMAALKYYSTGAQNFVLADDQGHIAYDPHAFVPVRQFADIRLRGANVMMPWLPLPGDGTAEWGDGTSNCAAAGTTPVPASCWIADDLLPHGKDPAKGYYFTANSDPTFPSVSDDNNPLAHPPYLSFSWGDSTGFRATRIDQLLGQAIAAHGSVSLDDMEAIQSDHVSRPGKVFTDLISYMPVDPSAPPEVATARAVLAQWAHDGWDCPSGLLGIDPAKSPIDPTPAVVESSAGCFLFHAFLRDVLNRVFGDDLAVAGLDVDPEMAIKAMIYLLGIDPGTPEGAAATRFCNDVDRAGQVVATHSCADQVAASLVAAVDLLATRLGPSPSDWVWGRAHTLTPVSPFPLVTTGFEPGPFARPGGAYTVDVATPSLNGTGLDFSYGSGGSVRHISLMSVQQPVVKMQLPGPERDGPADFAGPNLLELWLTNTYFDFAYGDQIAGAVVSTQTFTGP